VPFVKNVLAEHIVTLPKMPVPRAEAPFTHWFVDCIGLILNTKTEYNYCLVMCDSATRWSAAYPLKSLTATITYCQNNLLYHTERVLSQSFITQLCLPNVKEQQWMTTRVPAYVSSDNASSFTSNLNKEFHKRVGCSPRFNIPGHLESSGLVERMVGMLKNMINKVAHDHPKQWHKHLSFILWALREVPSETIGIPPWVLAFGYLPRGPLAVLKEMWSGEVDLAFDLGKNCH